MKEVRKEISELIINGHKITIECTVDPNLPRIKDDEASLAHLERAKRLLHNTVWIDGTKIIFPEYL